MFALPVLFLANLAIGCAPTVEERPDLRRHFADADFVGTCVVYDVRHDHTVTVNGDRADRPLRPASTFKIMNSLIALETGVVRDEHTVFKWDGTVRERAETNRDHDLTGAFRKSVLWYYEVIADRVGRERMQQWLDRVGYGNRKAGGDQAAFWLHGDLRISARQQVEFLARLYRNDLPFSQRSMDVVKRLMLVEDRPSYVLRAKTGWARSPHEQGWWVGWVERREGNAYVFATNIESNVRRADFAPARMKITRAILRDLGALPGE
jgi:beta-lactamase class D